MNASEYYSGLEKERIDCDLCGAEEQELLYEGDRYGMGLRFVWCRHCGLVFVNPRPTRIEMQRFYQESYRRFYESVEAPTPGYIESGVYSERAQYAVNMLSPYYEDADDKAMLDIGCAEGSLLRAAKSAFPLTRRFGVEPSAAFGRFAQTYAEADVAHGDWEGFFEENDRIYDLITCLHVLEHCLNPLDCLKSIHAHLSADGRAYLEVPNIGLAGGMGQLHLAHLYLFHEEPFLMLLARAGLEVVGFCGSGLPSRCPAMAAVVKKGIPKKMPVVAGCPKTRVQTFRDTLPAVA